MSNKISYLNYLWTNAKYFFGWLIFPLLFCLYWITFQDDYIGDIIFTSILCGAIQLLIMIGLFVKWKTLK